MKKIAKIFLLVGTLSFATLSITTPLLHNHQIDFNDHYNCPAFILNTTFVSSIIIFFAVVISQLPKAKYKIIHSDEKIITSTQNKSIKNRAPPF